MWYFVWVIGLRLAVFFSILNALWLERNYEHNDAPAPHP